MQEAAHWHPCGHAAYLCEPPLAKQVQKHVAIVQDALVALQIVRACVVVPLQLHFPDMPHTLNVQLLLLSQQLLALLLKGIMLALQTSYIYSAKGAITISQQRGRRG